jgi:hypothetical protein
MAHDNKGVSKEEAIRRGWQDLIGDPPPAPTQTPAAVAQRAEEGKPAQVTPREKKTAERNPERVPPPGDMGPPEGPAG